MVLGDIHAPHIDKRVFTRIIDEVIPRYKPELILQIGDLYNLGAWSRWPKKQVNPKDELLEGRMVAESIWKSIQLRAPKARLIQLLGNHDKPRLEKLVLSKAPELEPFIQVDHLWQFPGVETFIDAKEPFILGDTLFTHGHRSKVEDYLKDFQYRYNVVVGHHHVAKIVYERIGGMFNQETRWCACAGLIGNPFDGEMNYRPLNKFFKWTQGVLLIEEGNPRFIPL